MYYITYDFEKCHDGFGSQIQRIISLYLVTKLFDSKYLKYFHSGIVLDRNVGYASLKDVTDDIGVKNFNDLFIDLNINFNVEFKEEIRIENFDLEELNSITSNQVDYNVLVKVCFCHRFIDNNPKVLEKFIVPSLNWIDNKINNLLKIAVHIRRGDVSLTQNQDRYVSVDFYIDSINNLTKSLLGHHLFEYNIFCDSISSDEINKIKLLCSTSKINFHINTDVVNTFKEFVNSDILIAGKSSFSYSASFLRKKGIILYVPISHAYSTKHIKLECPNSIIINKEKILSTLK